MTELKPPETQKEFFQEFAKESKKLERFPSIPKAQKPILLSTSVEQLILTGIVSILALCFAFFLGVLKERAKEAAPRVIVRPVSQVTSEAKRQAMTAVPVSEPARVEFLDKPYTIQLVTYKNRDLANKEATGLRRKGYFAVIIPSGDYFQVCAGLYKTSDGAKRDLRLFAAAYKDCFLRRR